MKLMLCRLNPYLATEISKNEHIFNVFGKLVTLDHGQLQEYYDLNLFESSYQWPTLNETEEQLKTFFEYIIAKEKITHCIIAQKLHRYSTIAEEVCKELNINYIWAEYLKKGN